MSQSVLFQAWSWMLTITNVIGLYLVGRKHIAGWVVGVIAQLLLLAYALVTQQSGFVAAALIYGAMHARNWRRWHQEARAQLPHAATGTPPGLIDNSQGRT